MPPLANEAWKIQRGREFRVDRKEFLRPVLIFCVPDVPTRTAPKKASDFAKLLSTVAKAPQLMVPATIKLPASRSPASLMNIQKIRAFSHNGQNCHYHALPHDGTPPSQVRCLSRRTSPQHGEGPLCTKKMFFDERTQIFSIFRHASSISAKTYVYRVQSPMWKMRASRDFANICQIRSYNHHHGAKARGTCSLGLNPQMRFEPQPDWCNIN